MSGQPVCCTQLTILRMGNPPRQTGHILKNRSIPGLIYFIWTAFILVFIFIVIPISSIGHSGGEQVPFTLLAYAVEVATWGYFILSILISILFTAWTRKYWIINLLLFLITGSLLFLI